MLMCFVVRPQRQCSANEWWSPSTCS